MPFFDIEFDNIIHLINRKKEFTDNLNDKQKVILFNQNLHIFSGVYGFRFGENKSLSGIDNQSFHMLQDIFPGVISYLPETSIAI